jgi:urease accessory protein
MSHQDGLLELHFARAPNHQTYLASRAQRFPLHLTAPMYLDGVQPGMAFVYMQNPTGMVLAGDRLLVRLVAEPFTQVHLTTPAATKVGRMPQGEAVEELDIRLGAGAYLEYVPEAIVPQAGSRFEQRFSIDLEEGATVVTTELISPGRAARGEVFAYDRLLRDTSVRSRGTEVCRETLLLEPGRGSLRRRGMFGSYTYLATLMAVAPGRDAEALAGHLQASLNDSTEVLAAAGSLPLGVGAFARILAGSSSAAHSALDGAWRAARQALLGSPPPRRRK